MIQNLIRKNDAYFKLIKPNVLIMETKLITDTKYK